MVAVNVTIGTGLPSGDAAIGLQNNGSVASNDTTGGISGSYFSSYRSTTTAYNVDITASGGGAFDIGSISGVNPGTMRDGLQFQGLNASGSVITGYSVQAFFDPTNVDSSYSSTNYSLNFVGITTLRIYAINNYGKPFYFDSPEFTSISSGSAPAGPSVASIVRSGGASAGVATSANSVDYTVTFNEAVSGVDAADFNLAGSTGTASGTITAVSGAGATYTVTVNNLSGDGTLRLDLNGTGTGIQNGAGGGIQGGYTSGATYTLDHTAPAAPSVPDLHTVSDSGNSNNDNITSVTTPVFTGTAESGSTVTLYDTDGTTVLGTGTATGGNWSIASSTLSEGSHTLTVKATDAAGNTSSASPGLTVDIDTAAPASLALSTANATTSNATSTSTIATLSASDAHAVTYALATGNGINDADNGSFTVSGNSLRVGSASLAAGTYHVYLAATDVAGNIAFQSANFTVVDAPTVSSIVRAGGASSTVSASVASLAYTVTFSESVTGVDASDFALVPTGTASGQVINVSGSGSTYTVGVDALAGDGTLRLDLNGIGTGIQNGANTTIAGGFTSGQIYTLDHTAPTATIATAAFSADTGSSAVDFHTKTAAQTISGTLSANLGTGERVLVSLDGGTSYAAATVNQSQWSLAGQTLTSSGILKIKVADAAGNDGAVYSQPYTLDTTAPTIRGQAITATNTGLTIDLGEAVLAGTGTIKLLDANGQTAKTWAASASVGSNVAAYTILGSSLSIGLDRGALAPGSYRLVADASVIEDTAGNASVAVTTLDGIGFVVQAPPQVDPEPTAPPLVDGVSVTTGVQTLPDGSSVSVTTVPVVTGDRVNTDAASSAADIPLVLGTGGSTLLMTQVPTGYGLQAIGPSTSGLEGLIVAIKSRTVSGSPDQNALTGSGSGFLGGLAANTNLTVRTIVPTVGTGSATAPSQPLVIQGQPLAQDAGQQQALVIDASQLPAGSTLQLNNVDFAAVIGAATVRGSATMAPTSSAGGLSAVGALTITPDPLRIYGDSAAQIFIGGTADDLLSGGAGTDTLLGGEGGDLIYGNLDADMIYGNQGADTLFGGQGDDRAFGGQGDDRLFGNLGNDVLFGSLGADIVYGNQGNDIAYGNQGADILFGGQGNDVLYGGQDADTLVGGIGDDTLLGGLGADLYHFDPNSGRDLILGFSQADGDRIALGGQTYTVSSAQNGDALLTLSGGGVVDLAGIRAEQVNASYFAA